MIFRNMSATNFHIAILLVVNRCIKIVMIKSYQTLVRTKGVRSKMMVSKNSYICCRLT